MLAESGATTTNGQAPSAGAAWSEHGQPSPQLVGDPAVVVTRLGEGRPTLLLHGGGPGCTSCSDFAEVTDWLVVGRELLLVDLPQFGHADAPHIDGPVLSFHAARLADLLDSLELADVDVVAQSLGGGVALCLAAERPELIRRIVATGSQPVPFARADDPRIGLGVWVRQRYYGGDGPSLAKMRELIGTLEWHDASAVPQHLVGRRHAASMLRGPYMFGLDHQGRGEAQDLSAVLPDVAADVLLIWGEHDPFADPGYAHDLARRLPHAQVRVVANAAHHPQSEYPQLYAGLVGEFLSTLGPTEQP